VLEKPGEQGGVRLGGARGGQLGGAQAEEPNDGGASSDEQREGASHGVSVKQGVEGKVFDQREPLSDIEIEAEKARQDIQNTIRLRPLRLTRVGREQPLSAEDRKFVRYAIDTGIPLSYHSPNPKSLKFESGRRYKKYMAAKTAREAFELGASKEDFDWDYARGWISFPTHEPVLPGHVFDAFELAKEHNMIHVLNQLGHDLSYTKDATVSLARDYSSRGKVVGVGEFNRTFNELLETIYEPEVIVQQLEDAITARRFADERC
jgi:hypothetical protein